MKKKLLMIVLMLLSFCSCEVTQGNFNEKEPLVFSPSETLDYNVENIKNLFIESKYFNDISYEKDDIAINNYMPKKYSKKYDIDLFSAKDKKGFIDYYIRYQDEIYEDFLYIKSVKKYHINSLAFSDLNNDGFFELSFVWQSKTKNSSTDTEKIENQVFCFDSLSKKFVQTDIDTNNYVLFDVGNENNILMYESSDDNLDESDKLIDSIIKNNKQLVLKEKEFHLKATNYEVDITFDDWLGNFPLVLKNNTIAGEGYRCYVHFSLKWLGNDFTFFCDSDDITALAYYNDDNIYLRSSGSSGGSYQTIKSGQQITRCYVFYPLFHSCGNYDLKFMTKYDNEEIIAENVLEIKYS